MGLMHAGGENGFNQAIELSSDTLANVKFVQEKRLISKFFDEISQDTGKYVSGVADTLSCLEMGAVDTLIVWEDLPVRPLPPKRGPMCCDSLRELKQAREGQTACES